MSTLENGPAASPVTTAASPSTAALNIAFVLVVLSTIGMFLVDQSMQGTALGTQLILAMAVAKSLLIASVFMGLLWSARGPLAILAASFLALGLTLLMIYV